jgi:exodeoxyribonuclease V alpha subunit
MTGWEDQLDALEASAAIEPFDLAFGRFMGRLDSAGPDGALIAGCVASNWVTRGHVCAPLAALAGRPLFPQAATSPLGPSMETWRRLLDRSGVVGTPGTRRPLILDRSGRLYLYRYWDFEQRLASALTSRALQDPGMLDGVRARQVLAQVFGPPGKGPPDLQRRAASVALLRRLCVISGGPGTGKTTTVVRLLALLQGLWGGALRVGLAAPTGKAAARLQAAVESGWRGLPGEIRDACPAPDDALTLHRLLGLRPNGSARHGTDNPLPLDVLVVDEASMVDLGLMVRVTEALDARSRLILLGDKDQLASVEAGAVLGDICLGNEGFSPAMAAEIETLSGEPVASEPAASAIADCITLLEHSHRFDADSGIGRLARAVNRGDVEATLELLAGGVGGIRSLVPEAESESGRALMSHVTSEAHDGYDAYREALRNEAPPADVLRAFDRYRILCPYRVGRRGTRAINEAVERAFGLGARGGGVWYAGRPVLIGRNDHRVGLFNGDLGIALPAPDTGRLRVYFETGEGTIRSVAPGRLPEHETAFALTVHKSQGSEFERVLVVLPATPGPLLGRELLYTGITRARDQVTLIAGPSAVRQIVAHRLSRVSGLAEALAESGADGQSHDHLSGQGDGDGD